MISKINLKQLLGEIRDFWYPRVVAELNGQHVRLVKIVGDFEWHHHADEDELFLVLDGRIRIDTRDGHVWLEQGEAAVVPRGVEHKPSAQEPAAVLLFEPASTINTGNIVSERTRRPAE